MNKLITAAAVAALIGTSAIAGGTVVETEVVEPALTGFYLGGAYSYNTAELSSYDDRVRIVADQYNDGLTLIAGYNFNDFIAVEGRYSGLYEADYIEGNTWSIFAKPQYPVSPEVKVYGLIGFGGVTLDDVDYGTIMDNETNFQYGAGAAYAATKNVELFVDYTIVYDDNVEFLNGPRIDLTNDAVTFGANYKF